MAPFAHRIDVLPFPLDKGFDSTVTAIAYPALQLQRAGLFLQRGAKTNALDAARDMQMQAQKIRLHGTRSVVVGTVQFTGAASRVRLMHRALGGITPGADVALRVQTGHGADGRTITLRPVWSRARS